MRLEPANDRTDGKCPAWDYNRLLGCNKPPNHRRGHRFRIRLSIPRMPVSTSTHPSIEHNVATLTAEMAGDLT